MRNKLAKGLLNLLILKNKNRTYCFEILMNSAFKIATCFANNNCSNL